MLKPPDKLRTDFTAAVSAFNRPREAATPLGRAPLNEKIAPQSVPDKHQLKVLKQLLRAPDGMVGVMGGGYNTKEEVRDELRSKFGWTDSEISSYENYNESKSSRVQEGQGVVDLGRFYYALLARGIPTDHHESDLYFLMTSEAEELLSVYNIRDAMTVSTFSTGNGELWGEIPFGYASFFGSTRVESKRTRQENYSGGTPTHADLVALLMLWDERARSRSGYNPSMLPLCLEALDDVELWMSQGTSLRDALLRAFNGSLLKFLFKRLGLSESKRVGVKESRVDITKARSSSDEICHGCSKDIPRYTDAWIVGDDDETYYCSEECAKEGEDLYAEGRAANTDSFGQGIGETARQFLASRTGYYRQRGYTGE